MKKKTLIALSALSIAAIALLRTSKGKYPLRQNYISIASCPKEKRCCPSH